MSDWDAQRNTYRLEPLQDFVPEVGRRLRDKGLSKDAVVVLIFSSGDRSSRGANRLAEEGYTKVYSVVDGFEGERRQAVGQRLEERRPAMGLSAATAEDVFRPVSGGVVSHRGSPQSSASATQVNEYEFIEIRRRGPAASATLYRRFDEDNLSVHARGSDRCSGCCKWHARPGNLALAQQNACTACHAVDKKVLGPAYQDVAKKYAAQKDAGAQLSDSIRKGGAGKWGPVPMPAQPSLSEADAKTLAEWILTGAK